MEPNELFELLISKSSLPDFSFSELTLVNALEGFADAGNAVKIASNYLIENFDSELIVKFDPDKLVNYRTNRSALLFDNNQYTYFDSPKIVIHAIQDSNGKYFLLLSGSEPDLKWQAFADSIAYLGQQFNVKSFVSLNAFPMNVPHTRPIIVSAHGNNSESFAGYNLWNEKFQVPGNINGLLELKMDGLGLQAYGFSVHVPHYLAQMEFPAASLQLLKSLAEAENLQLSLDKLEAEGQTIISEINEQLVVNTDFRLLVTALEEQYDKYTATKMQNPSLISKGQRIPTGDELGAELERYLAQKQNNNDDKFKFFNNKHTDNDSDKPS